MPAATLAGGVGRRPRLHQAIHRIRRQARVVHRRGRFSSAAGYSQDRESGPASGPVRSWPAPDQAGSGLAGLESAPRRCRRLSFCTSTFSSGHADLRLRGADVDVAVDHIADQRDQRIIEGRDGGEEGGLVRLDLAAVFAPEVNFPRGGEEELVGEEIRLELHAAAAAVVIAELLGEGRAQRCAGLKLRGCRRSAEADNNNSSRH